MRHARYFLAVCEALNFTKAAEANQLSQPALSRAIQQFESEIGGALFIRERNVVKPTELAVALRPMIERAVQSFDEAKLEAKRFLTLKEATIKLGVMSTVGPRAVTAMLSHFRACYPGINITILQGSPQQLASRLEAGEIDVAILASPAKLHERFDLVPLYSERFHIAFHESHDFHKRNVIPIRALHGQNYLRRYNCEFRDLIAEELRTQGCIITICYQSEREDWIQTMVAGGLGICFLPEFNAMVPGLQLRPVIEPEFWRDVRLVTIAGRRLSPAHLAFMKTARTFPWPQSQPGAAPFPDEKR